MGQNREKTFIEDIIVKIGDSFDKVTDPKLKNTVGPKTSYSVRDCLMSGLAMFSMKSPSLLQFEKDKVDPAVSNNLKNLFGVINTPSDTQLRARLDEIDYRELRSPFKIIFRTLQRGKYLEQFRYLDDSYIVAIDGTGQYSSHSVSCTNCCVKEHKNGDKTYYHQLLGASLVHPDLPHVVPLAPEPILKNYGSKKNDCEKNASKRLLADLKREHPHLKIVVVEDGLASNAPHIRELRELKMNFILGCKEGDHEMLFEFVNSSSDTVTWEEKLEDGTMRTYRYLNGVPLNEKNFDLEVNFLEYWETKSNGKKFHFSWVSDFEINNENAYKIMRAGRSRWRIENEVFNTLKNNGYNFEHNFGHGYNNLCSVFTMLMMLAFLLDQAQEICCSFYKAMRNALETKKNLWRKMSTIFWSSFIKTWKDFYIFLAKVIKFELPSVGS